jgi:hypothetical protein
MSREELKALCDLIMCSDPWPVCESTQRGIAGATDEHNQETVAAFADRAAIDHGFTGWEDAYHKL